MIPITPNISRGIKEEVRSVNVLFRKEKKVKICKKCGKEFVVTGNYHEYCSKCKKTFAGGAYYLEQ